MQVILGLALLLLFFLTLFFYVRSKGHYMSQSEDVYLTIDFLIEEVYKSITEQSSMKTDTIMLESIISGKEDTKEKAIIQIKNKLEMALKECRYGRINAKNYVKGIIKGIVALHVTEDNWMDIIPDLHDSSSYISFGQYNNVLWELLIYIVTQKKEKKFFNYLQKQYKIFDGKLKKVPWTEDLQFKSELDTPSFIHIVREEFKTVDLDLDDYINVITQIVYSKYKGFGILDSSLDLDMDEMDAGTSGRNTRVDQIEKFDDDYDDLHSIFYQYRSTMLHASCLSFESQNELERITVQFAEQQDTPGLTLSNPTKALEDLRGRRVATLRPSVSENFVICYRSSDISRYTLDFLIHKTDEDGNDMIKNWMIPMSLVKIQMNAAQTMVYTGLQNTGKTTMMKGGIAWLPYINIGTVESVFEIHAKNLFPDRNIVSVQRNQYRTITELIDFFKKCNREYSFMGEAATHEELMSTIQLSLTGSRGTCWSSHQLDDLALVTDAAQGAMEVIGMTSYQDAVGYVLQALKANCHCGLWRSADFGFNYGNQRIIEYMSEIEKVEPTPFPDTNDEWSTSQAVNALNKTQEEYYRRITEAKMRSHKLVTFNPNTAAYDPGEWYTKDFEKSLYDRCNKEMRELMLKIKHEYYGLDGGI